MNLRFSRSSLNLIIFACIILIGWASIDKNNTVGAEKTQSIELPALGELNQQAWFSHEGIQVIWQTRLDTNFKIRIRGQLDSSSNHSDDFTESVLISWQPSFWQWDLDLGSDFEASLSRLNQQIADFPSELTGQPATIILQGPWSTDIARLTSARLIKSLKLKPLKTISAHNDVETKSCPWQPVSAQFWLQDQLSNANLSRADINNKKWILSQWPQLAPINTAALQAWKQTFVHQWQLNWQNPSTQFDIMADLAYYRLPENYLLQGYWGINALDVKQLQDYLAQCSTSEQASEQLTQQ